jgi:hypothetical protein
MNIVCLLLMCFGIAYGAYERGRRKECDYWLNWIENTLYKQCPAAMAVSLPLDEE